MKKIYLFFLMCFPLHAVAQTSIYPCHFNLSEVELLPGMFRAAADRNVATLMAYDVDRLLTPFVRQAGLVDGRYAGWLSEHPSFRNWGEKDWSLEGHVGGHYLTALSLAWASTHDVALKRNLGERIDYMLSVLDDCQRAFDSNTDGMKGFLGGQPVNQIWTGLHAGDLAEFDKYGGWVPLYCEHKVLAGLRDVWLYTGNEKARGLFRKMADWAVELIANIDDAQMQRLLDWEHGGMNETLADAYRIFGDRRYLDAACRYSHRRMLDGMQNDDPVFLNGMHANTQVPKYIGFERISQELGAAGSDEYGVAARNFWTDVTARRTVCIGGNSVSEHFLAKDVCGRYMTNLEGPETCNSNNMLKLSEMLFDDSHDARYADFYENVLYNHILSTQDPVTGGYVYFTSLRPQSYRIYSQVNQGMWCCVGTGMENHCKYGHFIYSRSADDKILYVNLFIPSKLENERFALTQTTDFPYVGRTKLTIDKSGSYTIALRHPAWVQNGFAVSVNGMPVDAAVESGKASYVEINRIWKRGDVVEVTLPMALRYEECPNLPDYIAFKYGPVLLAAQTTAVSPDEAAATGLVYESLPNEYGGEGRMDHSPGRMATAKDLSSAPMLLCDRADVLNRVAACGSVPLEFIIDVTVPRRDVSSWSKLVLKPFYSIHHARYSCYFYQQTEDMYIASGMAAADRAARELIRRTLDFVAAGEQQSEAGHGMKRSDESRSGTYRNESYRDAAAGGYVEYVLATGDAPDDRLSLMLRFSTKDTGRRASLIVEGEQLSEIEITPGHAGTDEYGFYNEEIALPASVLTKPDGSFRREITVRLAADASTSLPCLFHLRLLRH